LIGRKNRRKANYNLCSELEDQNTPFFNEQISVFLPENWELLAVFRVLFNSYYFKTGPCCFAWQERG
jgi:hypothetical protein